jgi:hypothetical protein
VAVPNTMDPLEGLRQHLGELDPDLVRSMLATFVKQLMSADAQTWCNAGYGERTPVRTNSRNGYRSRDWDTTVGRSSWRSRSSDATATSGLIVGAAPTGRTGNGRGDRPVLRRACKHPRRVEDIAHAIGTNSLSKSQVSELVKVPRREGRPVP